MPEEHNLATNIEAHIAQVGIKHFVENNCERWAEAEPIGWVGGTFIVVPPGVEGWQVMALDHNRQLIPIAPPLMPGFVYRVKVEVLEQFDPT